MTHPDDSLPPESVKLAVARHLLAATITTPRYALPRDYVTGYATENVVPVTEAVQDAMLNWIESLHWATGEDVR